MKSHSGLLAAAVLSLASCVTPKEEIRTAELVKPGQHPERPLFEWNGAETAGPISITISLAEQKAKIYRSSKEVGWTYVATGRSGYPSPRGSFSILEKQAVKSSNKYGSVVNSSGNIVKSNATAGVHAVPAGGRFVGAPMPYWMRLTSYGVGMHAGPIPNPGSPASHGCIRLPPEMAETLFPVVEVGTPVTIK
jgi:lipoprotein-anchoring transpeptidase ErfK/SrfK